MLKVDTEQSLNHITVCIYNQNLYEKFETVELAVADLMAWFVDNRGNCVEQLPTEFKLLKIAYQDWNKNGKVRESYELS